MHRSWLLSAPSPSSLLPHHRPPFSLPPCSPLRTRFFVLFPSRCIPIPGLLSVPRFRAIAEAVDNAEGEEFDGKDSNFINVGYISAAHGLEGELRVKPSTDFPELRFSKPGKRWLRTRITGKELISEVELTGGRAHPGQKSWIISLHGIDTVEKAKQMVGSTLLVREGDRPELDEDEFYTPDLFNMRVFLKETGTLVGTVVNVVNTGANDVLQVRCHSTGEGIDWLNSTKPESSASGHLVWIPFVEAIVPHVDMDNREMWITPPKGLLELNLHSDPRSKKERRQLEWKQRKKIKYRVISAKRKLSELRQNHVLEGLKIGEKDQRRFLAGQIAEINFKLLQCSLESIRTPIERYDLPKFIDANSAGLMKSAFKISQKCLNSCKSDAENSIHYGLYEAGLQLLRESKAATIILLNDNSGKYSESVDDKMKSKIILLQKLLLDCKSVLKMKEDISFPLILISPAHEIQSYEQFLLENDYFGFSSQKIWLLEEEKLPVVGMCPNENTHKILLKSPWDIIQYPVGAGGVYSLLSSDKIIDGLSEIGVEYVQICSLSERSTIAHPLFFGLVNSCNANTGIKIFDRNEGDGEFDGVFSLSSLKNICKQTNKLQFNVSEEQLEHVELVDKEWIEVRPDVPNAYHFHCSIYSFLNTCSLDDMCLIHILD
ncbi:UDPGP family protein [Dioscorea alata]|uniref:UDPGP family protein n=1 Tax=Dioscorea alata TaxID=55571 RepID=A0ACB7WE95_DIOAL|nr:UDPGP family protein [Dioscorea alata]